MNQFDAAVAKRLLSPAGLEMLALERVLQKTVGAKTDYADLFLQHKVRESWRLEEGQVKESGYAVDQGFGLRVVSGEKTGFAYADEIVLPALEEAAKNAYQIARVGQSGHVALQSAQSVPALYTGDNPLQSFSDEQKVSLLKQLDQMARAKDKRISQVMLRLSASHDTVMILNQLGEWVTDLRPMVSLHLQVIMAEQGRLEQGFSGAGGRLTYAGFIEGVDLEAFVEKAVNQARVNLNAVPAPAGTMPVVLGPGWPGVLLHEAIGHGLEGDFNRKGSSAFSGRVGERVASAVCTVVDDGALPNRRGSLSVDDEGVQTGCTMLIEKGVLKGYMQDRHNARLMQVESTGNGRRESYAHRPLPRMTNTYMQAGDCDPEEIIASVDRGIYAVDFAGGQVDITSGKFVFSMSEAYLIEKGKLTTPLKGATIIGDGPSVLKQVSMVGSDLALDPGIGVCGKDGQSVPVGVGQPTLRVDEMLVGGSDLAEA